jgi:hypothetical protein
MEIGNAITDTDSTDLPWQQTDLESKLTTTGARAKSSRSQSSSRDTREPCCAEGRHRRQNPIRVTAHKMAEVS